LLIIQSVLLLVVFYEA